MVILVLAGYQTKANQKSLHLRHYTDIEVIYMFYEGTRTLQLHSAIKYLKFLIIFIKFY